MTTRTPSDEEDAYFKQQELKLREKVAKGVFMPMGLSQQWGMYAPDPMRGQNVMAIYALEGKEDGYALEEAREAPSKFGTHWVGNKTRMDIWKHRIVTSNLDKPSRMLSAAGAA